MTTFNINLLDDQGRLEVTLKLVDNNYWSVSTSTGRRDDLLRFPEAAPILDLHLRSERGEPMHFFPNLQYFLDRKDIEAVQAHLWITHDEAERITKDYTRAKLAQELRNARCESDPENLRRLKQVKDAFVLRTIEAHLKTWDLKVADTLELAARLANQPPKELDSDPYETNLVRIGQTISTVQNVFERGFLPLLEVDGQEWYIAQSSEEAGEAAMEYWRDMAENDKEEFVELIGKETLIEWAMGHRAGPGTFKAHDFEGWLEHAVKQYPEEQWASYDGVEADLEISACLATHLGWDDGQEWIDVVAYRHN